MPVYKTKGDRRQQQERGDSSRRKETAAGDRGQQQETGDSSREYFASATSCNCLL